MDDRRRTTDDGRRTTDDRWKFEVQAFRAAEAAAVEIALESVGRLELHERLKIHKLGILGSTSLS